MKALTRILQAVELKQIAVRENQEEMIWMKNQEDGILCRPRRQTNEKDSRILVRKSVFVKLQEVQARLQKKYPSKQLMIVEGYRHPFVQEREFLHHFLMLSRQYPTLNVAEMEEKVHQWIALPSVAGHPTGGAVDVTLMDQGQEVNMGCPIADFSQPACLPTFAVGLLSTQLKERVLLHDLMLEAGFAPFYGEWWHFSFGDCEWAAFYNRKQTVYGPLQIELEQH
jgi:D-alanyl-D-alanine dipeptidase